MRAIRCWLVLILFGVVASPVHADGPHCTAPEYSQFDFWLGDWQVSGPDGKSVGHNLVEKTYGGCVVQQHWTSLHGGTGGSFIIYDAIRKLWHETWVDSSGGLSVQEGGLQGGSMVLSGSQVRSDGTRILDRTTWTPEPWGVHEYGEISTDGGQTWKTAYVDDYRKGG